MGDEVKYVVQKIPMLNKRIILKKDFLKGNIRLLKPAFKEDVVFETAKCDFLPGEYRKFTLLNRTYFANNTIKTIAKFESHSGIVKEKTSDDIVKLIGQTNYDTVFSSLCSVFNQELKIRGVLSLLTVPKKNNSTFSQADLTQERAEKVDISSQTDEKDLIVKPRYRRKRQALTPYVVQDKPEKLKKYVVKPDDFKKLLPNLKTERDRLPELGIVFDDNSNDSIGKFSSLSVETTPELLNNPSILLENVDRHTENVSKGTIIQSNQELESMSTLPVSPSTSEKYTTLTSNIKSQIMPEQRMKLVLQQASNDWKSCLQQDEDGYLPIHHAVLKNDLDLLRRQCIILKIRNENVDKPATGGITALKMSLYEENGEMTAILLRFGADPLAADEDNRTPFHIAAEMAGDHMQALVNHCRQFARVILNDEELWKSGFEAKSDEELSKYLLNYICKLDDSQGYTPLMLASKVGKYTNVRQLVEIAPDTVNMQMTNSGNTALYLAVGAACMDAAEKGNKTKVSDNFRQTIEILLENGADPNICNFSNSNVNDLVTEYTCVELSMLIANKLTAAKFMPGENLNATNISTYMLVKEKDGEVNLINMSKKAKSKFVIVANELYKPATSDAKKPIVRQFSKNVDNSDESQLTVTSSKPTVSSPEQSKSLGNSNINVVKNYKLNKPLIIKPDLSKNKRKLGISIGPEKHVKKTKT